MWRVPYIYLMKSFRKERGHVGIPRCHFAVLRMSIDVFQPTEIPWEIDTPHRSSFPQRMDEEGEREERLCLPLPLSCRTEARPKGNSAGAWRKSRLPTACGRLTATAHIGKGFGTDTS